MNRFLYLAALIAGLGTLCWVGLGYIGVNTLALVMTVVMTGFFVMGLLELHRFGQATASLSNAVAAAAQTPADLGAWLALIPPSLQNVVRLRIEGERVGLPGPALTPYLAGLLVLLGMLGTFVGMVVTLKGTGLALDSATDLQSIRDSLSAPVKGLGLAFGTSVAGVAASAMLGLMSALRKTDRLAASQALDASVATSLRVFSRAHQRELSFQLLQQQAALLPEVVGQLQAWMNTMAAQDQQLKQGLLQGQQQFHRQTEAAYTGLATSVDRSLQQSLTESARVAGAAMQPLVEATMAGLARDTASLQQTISTSVQRQLDGLASEFKAASTEVTGIWTTALTTQQQHNQQLSTDLRSTLAQFTGTFEERSAALVNTVSQRLETTVCKVSEHWNTALAEQNKRNQTLTDHTQQALTAAATGFEQQAAALLGDVRQAQADAQRGHAAHEEARLAAWTAALQALSTALHSQWQQTSAAASQQWQQLSQGLVETSRELSAHNELQAKHLMAEMTQLVQTVSDAPRAAAEVMAELRNKLSDSMARDNSMLEERSRILETLSTLLQAVNHASTEQRAAIDALVSASADVLERVGSRFTQTLDAHTDKMGQAAAHITGSAVEVASLGDAFGQAVQLFGQSNEQLMAQLQRIEGALSQSMARSDEQLNYYVAQAREVIDLSISSQKHIVDELQQLARERSLAQSKV
jgi:Domain of unknown function (DUF802)